MSGYDFLVEEAALRLDRDNRRLRRDRRRYQLAAVAKSWTGVVVALALGFMLGVVVTAGVERACGTHADLGCCLTGSCS